MSRSRKKPFIKGGGMPEAKRFANKAVRKYKGYLSDGCEYKKLYPSWDIWDYICYWPESPKSFRK